MFDFLGIHPLQRWTFSQNPAFQGTSWKYICINAICSDLDESDEEMWQWIPPGGTTLIYLSRLKLFSQQMGNWKSSTCSIIFDKIFEIHVLWFQMFIPLSLTLLKYPIFFVFSINLLFLFWETACSLQLHWGKVKRYWIIQHSCRVKGQYPFSIYSIKNLQSEFIKVPPTLLNSPRMVVITLQKTPLIYSWCVGAGIWRWGNFI